MLTCARSAQRAHRCQFAPAPRSGRSLLVARTSVWGVSEFGGWKFRRCLRGSLRLFSDIFRREAPSVSRPDAAGADGTGARRSGELRAAASLSFLSSFDIFCWKYLSSAPRGRPGRTADGERDPFFFFSLLFFSPHVWIIFPDRGGSNLFRSNRGAPCRRSEDAGDPTAARSSLLSLFWSVFPRFGRNRLPGPSSPYCVCAVRHTMRALLGLRMRAGSLLFLFSQVIAVASLAQTGRC